MTTKKVVRKKFKIKNILLFFIFIILLFILGYIIYFYLINVNIKNIFISGNKYVSDINIIRQANLENYPKINNISKNKIEKKLKNIEIIRDVSVKKSLFGKIYINVEEYTPLFYNNENGNIILDDNNEISSDNIDANLPIIDMESITDVKKLKKLEKNFLSIDEETIYRISEIKYSPNNVDDERFLFIMNDGNYVYITLDKIEEINYYLNILPTLENKKGVLNLDYGNNFEILE